MDGNGVVVRMLLCGCFNKSKIYSLTLTNVVQPIPEAKAIKKSVQTPCANFVLNLLSLSLFDNVTAFIFP